VERLHYVVAYTPDMEQMKTFYRDGIGLPVRSESPSWVEFHSSPDGPGLGLFAVSPERKREIELCFEASDLESQVAALRARGVEFTGAIHERAFGRLIHMRDPEGNLLTLLKPKASGSGSGGAPAVAAGRGGSGAAAAMRTAPVVTTAIVNCRDMAVMKAFYRDWLGLRIRTDLPWWAEFDAGVTRLTLRPRNGLPGRERDDGPGVTIGFSVGDLMEWSDAARMRGVHFTTVPVDEDLGLFAGAADPEGYDLTFREPAPPKSLEEELAEEFEDDNAPQLVAIRKTVRKVVKALSRVAVRPEYKRVAARKKTPPKAAKAKTGRSTRGAGPAGSRLKPKRTADPKRARNRPATGRLKKAERRSLKSQKGAAARASKGKPVKRPVARRGRKR
jgi:catechol 2,3-dioxygenase-like lactoylglutathione lyase family enzyme